MKQIGLVVCTTLLLIVIGCATGEDDTSSDPTPAPTSTTAPEPPGASGTQVIGLPGLCETGDVATLNPDSSGKIRFSLPPADFQEVSDCSNGDDRDATTDEYGFIFFNPTAADYSFDIAEPDDLDEPSAKFGGEFDPKAWDAAIQGTINPWDELAYDIYQKQKAESGSSIWPPLFSTKEEPPEVGDEVEFRFPSEVDVVGVCDAVTSAILRKKNSVVRIFVDRDVPYSTSDATTDCSVSNTLCDGALTRIAGVIESNFVPLLIDLFAAIPDVNGDGTFSFVITPLVNQISETDGSAEDIPIGVVPHGFSMTTDLLPFDEDTNPCSNEQEVIYAHAPDPDGIFNFLDPIPLNTYISTDLLSIVPFHGQRLGSFDKHVFVNEGQPEEEWLQNVLSLMAVDLSGFFAYSPSFMFDVFAYLDLPSYVSLTSSDRWFADISLGMQYLFAKFLLDSQTDDTVNLDSKNYDTDLAFISTLYGESTGTQNLEENLEFTFDPAIETEFIAMFKFFSIAMAVAQTAMEKSNVDFPYYLDPNSTLYGTAIANASGSTRAGADGGSLDDDSSANPVGINLNGENPIVVFGSTNRTFLFENPDQFTYAPGNSFKGFTEGLAFNFVRVGGLFEEISNFQIEANSANWKGFVVRRPDIDPASPVVYSESVFGTLDSTTEVIGPSTVDYASHISGSRGTTLVIRGNIEEKKNFTAMFDPDTGVTTFVNVDDIDTYTITIPTTPTDAKNLAVWVEAQVNDDNGSTGLRPMLAVVSADDVPNLGTLTNAIDNGDNLPQWRYVIPFVDGENTFIVEDLENFDSGGSLPCDGAETDTSPDPIAFSTVGVNWGSLIYKPFFELFVLKSIPDDPVYNPLDDEFYEPRFQKQLDSDCFADADEDNDNALGTIAIEEFRSPSNFQEQILTYMAREETNAVYTSTHPLANTGTEDTLAVDVDSRDDDDDVFADLGNNIGGYSVKNVENSTLQVCQSTINAHISGEIPVASQDGFNATTGDLVGPMGFNPPSGHADCSSSAFYQLTAGQSYTIVVAGVNGTTGPYELKLRKFDITKEQGLFFLVVTSE